MKTWTLELTEDELHVLQKALDLLHLTIQSRARHPGGITISSGDLATLSHWRSLVAKLPYWEATKDE